MSRNAWFALCSVSAVLGVCNSSGQTTDLPVVEWQGRTMGSTYTVKVVGRNLTQAQTDALKAEVDERLKEVNRQMSHYQTDSELSCFNRAPARTPFKVSPEFARVVRFSVELYGRSHGAFDPTLAPIINLWGFGEKTDQRAVPNEVALRAAMKTTGCQHLSVTANDELVKDLPELTSNLSGVAKGFGVDEMVEVLRGHGLTNIYAAIAGEVRGLGHNPRGMSWQVGITAPLAHWREDDAMAAVASLSNLAISTSGDYQKFFTDAQGRRLCHIIDPKTGWPVQNNIGGVSVVAQDNMTADALATTLFVLGLDAGLRFIESWTNVAALFIVREAEGKFRSIPSSRFASLTGYQP
jgi:FAD:protein FMN transferase